MQLDHFALSNGIRVVHHRIPSPVAYCCLMVNAGTRDELDHEHGLAHFIEHVLFKGTKRRKAFHVMSRLEDVGGELNAYTAKEETVVHATMLKDDFPRAVELITDILFHSTFPDRELQKEKDVIIDEINSYRDTPSELIFDDFEDQVYRGHPFGRNILGSKKYVKGFTRNLIQSFMERNYLTDRMVFCSIGNIPLARVKKLADRYLGTVSPRTGGAYRVPINGYTPSNVRVKKHTYQHHCVVGCRAYGLMHPKRVSLHLLNSLLGGPASNSRLNLSLRERNGYAYNVESSYTPYTDTGLFSIYFGTDKENFERASEVVRRELQRVRTKRLGLMQLHKAKRQLLGQLAIAAENSEVLMLNIARSFLIHNSIKPMDELTAQVEAISASEIMDTANEVLTPNNLSTLTYY